jgi:hypothetical protein
LLGFSAMGAPFGEAPVPGIRQRASVTFYPGAAPMRARLDTRQSEPAPITELSAGYATIEEFLRAVAATLARQPWVDRFLCVLRDATPICLDDGRQWYLRDAQGDTLPLVAQDQWCLLALSGGHPVQVAGEWDGMALRPLGVCCDGRYHPLGGVA